MNVDPRQLISGYFDDTLNENEHARLTEWINASPDNARQFADASLLHDRLRDELVVQATLAPEEVSGRPKIAPAQPWRIGRTAAVLSGIAAALVIAAMVWSGLGESPASAAEVELNRVIAASARAVDRTYRITVEEVALSRPPRERDRRPTGGGPEERRPPKPAMDNALLHVRGGHQFVLVRTTATGQPFLTGSNGHASWAIRPDGPVRVSSDRTSFSRDLPGHEQSMALTDTEEALQTLRKAYDIQVLPVETATDDIGRSESSRLLVAVKKPGNRGPKRVEITYVASTGRILQMRFVEMPYGPESLTLRLTLTDESDLGPSFFEHTFHHTPERTVQYEESP